MTAGHHVADLGRHRQDSCYIPETRRKPDVPLATNIGFESRLLRQHRRRGQSLRRTIGPLKPRNCAIFARWLCTLGTGRRREISL